jgi:hypothetical protein
MFGGKVSQNISPDLLRNVGGIAGAFGFLGIIRLILEVLPYISDIAVLQLNIMKYR